MDRKVKCIVFFVQHVGHSWYVSAITCCLVTHFISPVTEFSFNWRIIIVAMSVCLSVCLQVYYHVVGTDQSEDILCYEDLEHPDWILLVHVRTHTHTHTHTHTPTL